MSRYQRVIRLLLGSYTKASYGLAIVVQNSRGL